MPETVMQQAFSLMAQAMHVYDQDQSRMLDINELNAFFRDQLPSIAAQGTHTEIIDLMYPPAMRATHQVDFPTFMQIIYSVLSRESSKVEGHYSHATKAVIAGSSTQGSGEQSSFCWDLHKAFAVLEADFARLDPNADRFLDKTGIWRWQSSGGRELLMLTAFGGSSCLELCVRACVRACRATLGTRWSQERSRTTTG